MDSFSVILVLFCCKWNFKNFYVTLNFKWWKNTLFKGNEKRYLSPIWMSCDHTFCDRSCLYWCGLQLHTVRDKSFESPCMNLVHLKNINILSNMNILLYVLTSVFNKYILNQSPHPPKSEYSTLLIILSDFNPLPGELKVPKIVGRLKFA